MAVALRRAKLALPSAVTSVRPAVLAQMRVAPRAAEEASSAASAARRLLEEPRNVQAREVVQAKQGEPLSEVAPRATEEHQPQLAAEAPVGQRAPVERTCVERLPKTRAW